MRERPTQAGRRIMLSFCRKVATFSALLGPEEGDDESEEILGSHHYLYVSLAFIRCVGCIRLTENRGM